MHVVIIGAGLLGLSTAFFLQRAGARVTLLDRNPSPGLETSFANGGLLTPSMAQPWNEPGILKALLRSIGREDSPVLLRARAVPSMWRWGMGFLREARPERFARNTARNCALALYSLKALSAIETSGAVRLSLHSLGTLNLYRSSGELDTGIASTSLLYSMGLKSRTLSAREAVGLEPALAPIEGQIAGAIHFPDDRSGDAYEFCKVIADAILAAGGTLLSRSLASGWRRERTSVVAVRTEEGEISGNAFVIAAGSYSGQLASTLGLYVPIYPVKGYSLSLPLDGVSDVPTVPVVDSSLHAAVAPLGSVLRVAGTAELAGFDKAIAARRIANLWTLLRQLYPKLAAQVNAQRATPWAGLRPVSQDGVPLIGSTTLANVYLNTGHGHLGWTLAAGSGQLLADLIAGSVPALDPAPYSPMRFK